MATASWPRRGRLLPTIPGRSPSFSASPSPPARQQRLEKALAELARLQPADPELAVLRASLAESRGRTDDALAELRAAVTQVPSWRNLYRLADLAARSGRVAEARGHFQALLARSPGNLWAREKLAEMELLYGDLPRAEQLYSDLLATSDQRSYWTNLGLTRFLLGRPAAAVEAYRKALGFDPEHVYVRLNLADALLALGREGEAKDLYARVLGALEANRKAAPPSAVDEMTRAQCLVQLGRAREAVELTQQTLQANPGDPQVVYLASLVYALAGDRASALVNAEAALDKGVQPRWFRLAAFAPLAGDSELLGAARRPRSTALTRPNQEGHRCRSPGRRSPASRRPRPRASCGRCTCLAGPATGPLRR